MAVYDINGNVVADSGGGGSSSVFVNVVTDYNATGGGLVDDSTAIQNALTALSETGGIIYFPTGIYKITTPIHFYSNQTLLFENEAVLKAGDSGQGYIVGSYVTTSMTAYTGTHDVIIRGATIDGSAFNANILLLGMAHAKNILIESCSFIKVFGLAHNIEINSSFNIKVKNCYFDRGTNTGSDAEMIQLDRATSGVYVEDINTDGTNCKCIDIYENYFAPNTASPAVGNHNGTPDIVNIHDNVFDTFTGTRGAIDLSSTNLSIYNNVFNGCTIGVKSEGATHFIHDNRFIGATTAISGSTSVAHSNMINGTYTA